MKRRSILKKKKTNRTNQIILGVGLVVIMFFSIAGYAFRSGSSEESSSSVNYNGFEFVGQNGYWYLEKGNFQFVFSYNPNEIERINSEGLNLLNSYSNQPVYISSENSDASSEIYRNLYSNTGIALRMQSACLSEEDCEGDLPMKTCEDNFIIIQESKDTSITQDEGCVFIQGPKEELVKIADEFLFKILDIS